MKTVRIRVEASTGGGYVVRLIAGGEGAADHDAVSASIPADLDVTGAPDVLSKGAVDEAVRAFITENEESNDFASIGEYLGGLLLRDEVGERWTELREQNAEGLLTLLDIDPPHLRLIPWELMSRDQGRLFLDETAVFARADKLRADEAQELVPLRVLVVEGRRDDGIGTATEMRGIKSALPDFRGRIDAEFLCEPTRDELTSAFRRVRPHILHFMGHGVRDPATKQVALQVGEWSLTRQYIMDSFLSPSPRLVVLNACRSGEVDDVRSLTEALLARGAAAVVAMQGDVRGEAAGRFGSELYRGLATGKRVDQAVAGARRAVLIEGGNDQARDWCLASLTLRVPPDQVLPLVYCISEDERELVERDLFEPIKLLVDRTEQRWKLAEAADPDEGSPERLVLLVGDIRLGKTALVTWIRMRCALRGRRVRYVSFKGEDNLNFVHALRVIEETPDDVASLAGPADAFDRFNYDVEFLVKGKIPPEPSGALPRTFPKIPRTLLLGGGNDERILESFRDALRKTTEKRPLMLVLDDIGMIGKSDFQTWFYPHLIQRIADGDPSNVRLLIVLSHDDKRDYWPSESTLGKEVEVGLIPVSDYEMCAEDLILALGQKFSALHAVTGSDPWAVRNL